MPSSRRWSLGPVRHPAFARLWLAGAVSETGDWLLLIALPVHVLQLTGSALVTSTVFLLGLLPGLVVGPLAGVLVDRWDGAARWSRSAWRRPRCCCRCSPSAGTSSCGSCTR